VSAAAAPSRPGSGAPYAGALLLVRPATFRSNPDTRSTNGFQAASPADAGPAADDDRRLGRRPQLREAVLHEFDQLAALLADELPVHVYDDTAAPPKPDAVFPADWLGTHDDGTVVLYPLYAPNRRPERRRDLLDALLRDGPYRTSRIVDLTAHERHGEFLEGAGSLVLDRVRRIAYACRSSRTHAAPLAAFARALDYEPVQFDAVGPDGSSACHTDDVLWIGERVAGVCADAIPDAAQRRGLLDRLGATHEIVEFTAAQYAERCGQMLPVRARSGEALLEMSHRAYHALTDAQRDVLRRHFRWLTAHPVYTIERLGGGSVRAMLAEVFLPLA
jgi:hypothetical protein